MFGTAAAYAHRHGVAFLALFVGGDLTGRYPNPTIAAGMVTSADFASEARSPDAAKLGGVAPAGYPQMNAHAYAGLLKGSVPLELASLSGVGTLSLSCEADGNADYQYVNGGAGEQTIAVDNGGTITRADLMSPASGMTKSVPADHPTCGSHSP